MKPEPGLALGGRYRLVRQIAVGGMGEVWVAKDESLARDIAIKVLKEEFVGNDDFLNRFRVEARNAASLSHAHIAQLYDYGEQDGSAYLVMELVHGEPMSDLLEREPVLPVTRLLTILAQTSRALHAAHVGGVVHRDIKPGNIIIEHSGDVKITDFGVSLAANQVPMTAAGMVMGTAQYLSPEQAIGKAATGASDIYALGIVAYEAIAGNRPFTGKTPVDIAVAHVNEPVPPLPKTTQTDLAAIVIRMLAKDPLERPRSGAALATIFESLHKEISDNPWNTASRSSAANAHKETSSPSGGSSVSATLAPAKESNIIDNGPQISAPAQRRISSGSRSKANPQSSARVQGGSGPQGSVSPQGSASAAPRADRENTSSRASGASSRARSPHVTPLSDMEATRISPRRSTSQPTPAASAQRQGQTSSKGPSSSHGTGGPKQGGDARQRTHSSTQRNGAAGTTPNRRKENQKTPQLPTATGIKARLKELGPIGLGLIAVVAFILLATLVKGLISSSGEQHTNNTVAISFSSVQFTSSANFGVEARNARDSVAYTAQIAQSFKDA